MVASRHHCRGSVFIEASLACGVFALALTAGLETVRRCFHEVLLHHGAFLAARAAVLGTGDPALPARRFWENAVGRVAARRLRAVDLSTERGPRGVVARAHGEFPTWMRFPLPRGTKHTFEVTRRCLFSLSR